MILLVGKRANKKDVREKRKSLWCRCFQIIRHRKKDNAR
jgi:hypothetical protein